MFLKIKNKFRFVSISLLLASLVTVVSSASAEETGEFDFILSVECAELSSASWAPLLEKWSVGMEDNIVSFPSGYDNPFIIEAQPGQTVEILIFLNWEDGTDCSGTTVPVTGDISGIFVGLPTGYRNDFYGGTNSIVQKEGIAGDSDIIDGFEIPDNASEEDISGTYQLTWTP